MKKYELTIENATNPLNEAKQKMLDNAMKQRNGLLEIARNNNDIFYSIYYMK